MRILRKPGVPDPSNNCRLGFRIFLSRVCDQYAQYARSENVVVSHMLWKIEIGPEFQ